MHAKSAIMTGCSAAGEKRCASAPVMKGKTADPAWPNAAQNAMDGACSRRGTTLVRIEMATG